MGTKQQVQVPVAPTSTGLGDALFSKVRQRVLGVLYGNPDRSFYANEIIKLARSGTGAVQRELAQLSQAGLVTVERIGRQKHYQANRSSPIFQELRSIVLKTTGLADVLRAVLEPLSDQIIAAFVYGSVAKDQDTSSSDIDLMVISDVLSYGDVFGALESASEKLGRTVNPTVYSRGEINKRIQEKNAFVTRVLAQDRIRVLGEVHVG